MRTYLIILSLVLISCEFDRQRHEEIVRKVNKLRTTWTAKLYDRDIKPLLGLKKTPIELLKKNKKTKFTLSKDDLPENYDAREAYPECETLKEIRDQSKCGSCWAFASVEVMSDRLCIHSKGKLQTRVSATDVVTCCFDGISDCDGGLVINAFAQWNEYGIPSGGLYGDKTTCRPYFLPPCDDHPHKCQDYVDTPRCEKKCIPEYSKTYEEDKTYGDFGYYIDGEEEIMKEIMEKGPVTAGFTVYEDFSDYSSGIYQHVTGKDEGGHAVKIIGWGVEDGVKYWLVANSWNERWGEKGYFRILRGVNECGIEDQIYAAEPKLR